MSVILFLIIVSLFVATGFLIAFLWAVKTGQFDDHFTPSIRMLMDDKKIPDSEKEESKDKK
ncbi:MAG: cbb3-type cytochrome oxidase assembly protein CcoS [Calditrichia bacterium]|nr:cbb3-type cytochrome oxidase assembly protein CcoS [Calditrichia bacterium]